MKWSYFFLCCLLFSCTSNRKVYEEKMNELQLMTEINRYNTLVDYHREAEGKIPDSLNEVYLAYVRTWPDDSAQIELQFFRDIFSKSGEWVGYFPIYDSLETQIVSYAILSAGIDGKLDNKPDQTDKLHVGNWKHELKLYNPGEFDDFDDMNGTYTKGSIENRPYNAKEEKSGGKDLLIYFL